MPGRTTAGKRYAQAIAAIARQDNAWEQWRRDLSAIAEALKRPEIRLTLESPRVPFARKQRVLDVALQSLGQPLARETSNLLQVMGRRGRMDLLNDVIAWFEELADEALGVRRYTVTTAVPLDDEERRRLQERLGTGAGSVFLTERVDPDILGGVVVRHEDVIRDYSVRARLESLRERLN